MALVAQSVDTLLSEHKSNELFSFESDASSKKQKKKFRTFPLLEQGSGNGKAVKDQNTKQKLESVDPVMLANLLRASIRSSNNLGFLQALLDSSPNTVSKSLNVPVPVSQKALTPRSITTFPPSPGPIGNLAPPSQLWGLGTLGLALFLSYSTTPQKKEEEHIKQEIWNYQAAVASIPHPSKKYKGGEDAYFISHHVFGVADGVGGWERHGIDPSLYSNKLMQEASLVVQETDDPSVILQRAYDASHSVIGSSTACIITFKESKLIAANLGDSGFLVIRDGEVIFRTKEQQHAFNFPYQLGTQSTNKPCHADIINFPLEGDEIVVMGTDGLLDNLFNEQIASMTRETKEIQILANNIALEAHKIAGDKTASTPFSVGAQKVGFNYQGGKMDDITVVVINVKKTYEFIRTNQK